MNIESNSSEVIGLALQVVTVPHWRMLVEMLGEHFANAFAFNVKGTAGINASLCLGQRRSSSDSPDFSGSPQNDLGRHN